jgi:hypothetical protein
MKTCQEIRKWRYKGGFFVRGRGEGKGLAWRAGREIQSNIGVVRGVATLFSGLVEGKRINLGGCL